MGTRATRRAGRDGQLSAYRHNGFWHPMDTLRDKNQLESMWDSNCGAMEGLEMNPEFWRGKRVLVTGHTGFKGSWLSLWLQSLQAEAIGYSLPPPTEPSLFALAGVANGMESIEGSVLDVEHLRRVVRQHEPEIVIHMAAQSLVRRSYTDPSGTYATNVMGTVNVLEVLARCPGLGQ